MSEKNNSPEKEEVKTKKYPTALLIRKRIGFKPVGGTKLEPIGLGYFVREVRSVSDVIEALREANMPGINQVMVEGNKLVITKRKFNRGVRSEKVGRYQRVTVEVRNTEEAIKVLREYGFINKQILPLTTKEEAKAAMEMDKESITKRIRRKKQK